MSSASDVSLETEFFGFNPRVFCDDVYNSADDLVADGMDVLEKLLIGMLPELNPGQKRSKGKANASDSQLVAEVKKGTDALAECLQETHQLPGDKFEVYCLMNIFKIPERYHDKIRAKLKRSGGVRSTTTYTAEQEKNLDDEIKQLEMDLTKERNRSRALLRVHALYSKRLPEAEEADKALGEALSDFSKITKGAKMETSLPNFVEKAQLLKDLCDRLSSASCDHSATSAAISGTTSLAQPPKHASVLERYELDRGTALALTSGASDVAHSEAFAALQLRLAAAKDRR